MRQKLILWSVLVVLTAMFTRVAPAMTMSELQSAVDAASAGDTVYLTSDVEFAAPLTVAKKITIASVDGEEKFVLYPASDYTKGTFMSLDSDYARLPVVLTGAATALGAEVALTFDKDMRKHMPAWSQSLFVAGAEESLSGNWMFALPEGAEKNWAVATTGEACSLTYTPSGSMMILR